MSSPFQRDPQVGGKRQNQVFSLPPDPTIFHPSSAALWPGAVVCEAGRGKERQ